MADTNVENPVANTPTTPDAVQSPTTVISGVDAQTPVPPVSTPPVSVQEPKQDVSTPVGIGKTEPLENLSVIDTEKLSVPPPSTEEVKSEVVTPYSYILCPKCGAEIKEEYFYANKKINTGGKGQELGFTARTDETGDRVFLIHEKKRYWIKNPETLAKLGFNLGSEKNIPFQELLDYPEYEPIDLTIPNAEFPRKDEVSPEEKKKAESGKPYKIWS